MLRLDQDHFASPSDNDVGFDVACVAPLFADSESTPKLPVGCADRCATGKRAAGRRLACLAKQSPEHVWLEVGESAEDNSRERILAAGERYVFGAGLPRTRFVARLIV